MGFPNAYIQFLTHFHGDRDYFECHEVLEEYWKQADSRNRQSIWVGLIQMAVSFYHHRRSNQVGAIKLMEKSIRNLDQNNVELKSLGIDDQKLMKQLNNVLLNMKNGESYQSINLPLCHDRLIELCKNRCIFQGFQWCSMSDFDNDLIINRHKLRDRSSIEVERLVSLARKQHDRDRQEQQLVHVKQ